MRAKMEISAFRGDYFRVISDGEKVVLVRDNGKERDCFILVSPVLSRWNLNIHRPMIEATFMGGERQYVPGLMDVTVDLTLRGGEIINIDRPLIMGVDIFNRLSVTDYLDIINEKIRTK
jgi:hypothetical protein